MRTLERTLSCLRMLRAAAPPDTRERTRRAGATPAGGSPEEFKAFMAAVRKKPGEVIDKTGIVLADQVSPG